MWKVLVAILLIDFGLAARLKCKFDNYTIEKYDALPASAVQYGCEVIELASRDIRGRGDVEGDHAGSLSNNDIRFIKVSKITFDLSTGLENVFKNLNYYEAKRKQVKRLHRKNFQGMFELKALTLINNKIEEIPRNVFDDLKKLVILNLEYNQIKSIAPDVVAGLMNLKAIFMYQNNCTSDTFYDKFSEKMNQLADAPCNSETNNRSVHTDIVGGIDQPITDTPFAAQIFRSEHFVCTGSILTMNFILTAGHCFDGMPLSDWFILVGHSLLENGDRYQIAKIILHYGYARVQTLNEKYWKNDLALMKTANFIAFGVYVQPAVLNEGWSYGEDGTSKIVGWGRTTPSGEPARVLQSAVVELIEVCTEAMPREPTLAVDYRNLCTTSKSTDPKGACLGDSGGMVLAYSNKILMQIGVISWGDTRCDNRLHPDVHVRVSSYIDWIKATLLAESRETTQASTAARTSADSSKDKRRTFFSRVFGDQDDYE